MRGKMCVRAEWTCDRHGNFHCEFHQQMLVLLPLICFFLHNGLPCGAFWQSSCGARRLVPRLRQRSVAYYANRQGNRDQGQTILRQMLGRLATHADSSRAWRSPAVFAKVSAAVSAVFAAAGRVRRLPSLPQSTVRREVSQGQTLFGVLQLQLRRCKRLAGPHMVPSASSAVFAAVSAESCRRGQGG